MGQGLKTRPGLSVGFNHDSVRIAKESDLSKVQILRIQTPGCTVTTPITCITC
jgi:hypothetical protein